MPTKSPFKIRPGKYSRNWWTKKVYFYLAEFFGSAQFDQNLTPKDGFCIDDYRGSRVGDYEASEADSATADDGWMLPCGGGSGDTGDYGFKVVATMTDPETWEDAGVPEFTVVVLNGTAQVFGGAVWPAFGNDQSYEFPYPQKEGTWVVVQYQSYNATTYAEIDTWSIQCFPTTEDFDGEPPSTLSFPIAQIGSTYRNNVNQLHQGAIVMPAVCNVVDLQGLPSP